MLHQFDRIGKAFVVEAVSFSFLVRSAKFYMKCGHAVIYGYQFLNVGKTGGEKDNRLVTLRRTFLRMFGADGDYFALGEWIYVGA